MSAERRTPAAPRFLAICHTLARQQGPDEVQPYEILESDLRRLWRDFGLSITLAVMFLAAWTPAAMGRLDGVRGRAGRPRRGRDRLRRWRLRLDLGGIDVRGLAVGVPADLRLQPAHWAYLLAILGGGTLAMLGLIAWLGSGIG
jgi:hypothetical protein